MCMEWRLCEEGDIKRNPNIIFICCFFSLRIVLVYIRKGKARIEP